MNFGRVACSLHEEALAQRLQPIIGRDGERDRLLNLLTENEARRILIIGHEGVGKTALIKGAAHHLAAKERPTRLYLVDPAALHADTVMVREHFSKLMKHCEAGRHHWLVIDEMSSLISDAPLNESQATLLDTAESGETKILYTLRSNVYRTLQEQDHPLAQGAEVIDLRPLDPQATTAILDALRNPLEEECATLIADEAVAEAVSLSQQYLPDRALPGSAIDVLSRASRRHRKKIEMESAPSPWMDKSTMKHLAKAVGPHDVRRVVGELTGFDVVAIETDGWKKTIADGLSHALPGFDAAVARLASAVALIRQDMAHHGQTASVLVLAGPTNSGKTRAAEILARSLPGHPQAAYLVDLGRYTAAEDVDRLYNTGKASTDGSKPLAVSVLKDLHKAHEEVRRSLGATLTGPEPHRKFAWGRGYQRSLHILTINCNDPSAVQADLLARTEHLLGLPSGRLKASALYFAPNSARKTAVD